MKNLRLLGEQLTDTPSHSTRSPEEWEKHERNGHIPKLPDCPVCVEEQGPIVRHYAQSSPSLKTLRLDTGYWGDWSLDEKRYFIAAALRVDHDKSGILIPFFVLVENKSAIVVSREVFALIDSLRQQGSSMQATIGLSKGDVCPPTTLAESPFCTIAELC